MLQIKQADANDIPLIRTLAMKVWPQTYTPIIGAEQVAYMLNRFYAPASLLKQMTDGDLFFIAYDDDMPIAFASLGNIAPDIYKLHKLYILPDVQGRGIGQYVINHIKDTARTLHATQLQLNVNRYNTNAIRFYEKTGFSVLRDEDIDIGQGYFMNDHVLYLDL